MTKLGEYLAAKSVNKSEVARKTGLSKARVNQLTINTDTKLRADELYMIAQAIGANPCDVLEFVCGGIKKLKSK